MHGQDSAYPYNTLAHTRESRNNGQKKKMNKMDEKGTYRSMAGEGFEEGHCAGYSRCSCSKRRQECKKVREEASDAAIE